MSERSIVIVDAYHLACTEFTPHDFLLDCAEVGLDGAPEVFSSDRERADPGLGIGAAPPQGKVLIIPFRGTRGQKVQFCDNDDQIA